MAASISNSSALVNPLLRGAAQARCVRWRLPEGRPTAAGCGFYLAWQAQMAVPKISARQTIQIRRN